MADFLDMSSFATEPRSDPFVMPWPEPANPAALLSFQTFAEWQAFILARRLHPAIPQIVSDKFRRAQKLYVLAWIDFDLVKAGELVALTALELALKDRYGSRLNQQKKGGERPRFSRNCSTTSPSKTGSPTHRFLLQDATVVPLSLFYRGARPFTMLPITQPEPRSLESVTRLRMEIPLTVYPGVDC